MTQTSRLTLTNLLVAINLIIFVWELATGGPNVDHGWLIGYDRQSLSGHDVAHGEWWRIFTAAFLHASWAHVGLNMFALFQVGNLVELLYGRARYALLYVLSIVGSGLAVLAFNGDVPTLGASGAIFGLFGALVSVGLRMGSRGRGLIGQVLPIIVLNLAFTYAIPGISAAAHVGGLLSGFVAGLVLFMLPSRQREVAQAYSYDPARDATATETIDQPPPPG